MYGNQNRKDCPLTWISLDCRAQRLRKVFWSSIIADMHDEDQ